MTSRQLILLLVILIGLGILFTAGKLLMTNPTGAIPSPTPTDSPIVTSDTTFTAALGTKVGTSEIAITPIEVVEDSRCPVDVQCIQAGTVRLRVELAAANLNTTEQELGLDKSLTVGNKTVTLIRVEPVRHAGTQIAEGDYRFTFEIK